MYVAHDSLLLMQQEVEQRALAHVGVADDSHRYAVFQCVSDFKRMDERYEPLMYVVGKGV